MLTKLAKHDKSSSISNLFLCLLLFMLISCNWLSDDEYVIAQVVNETNEDISVETGKTFITVDIMKGQTLEFPVVKDARISARGKITGTDYGSQSFSRDLETWIIH